ncbi:DUF1566 domain-containing protein [Vibrio lentus]|uniref:DUF1566 domain-containing protein n=1 Tax=Vibrio lentus TaxID=136468 RepID=UPI000C866890|nr:DUF1566 domain-containing protein [Vibrio lentus]PMJ64940.1 DUF1566 domain-containing protein [Vibrio lentus]PMM56692.1 DUF1566 domain-containing protein [Vibrio lentus]
MSVSLVSTMLMACGGAESDPKLKQSQTQPNSQNISGIALDGYLHNAKVCLDKNSNAMCDSADGEIATTDAEGRFQLDVDNDVAQYPVLVEAVAGITIDMDSPNQPIESGFTLEVPSNNSNVISPMTSLIASVSKTSGISFDEATQLVASDLGIDKQLAVGDYSASNSAISREVHMFARGVTRVLQEAQMASVDAGVDQVNARKGSMYKLAELDLAEFKAKTDLLSHGASGTDSALKQLGKEYRDHLKVSQEDIDGNEIITRPPAPKHGQVNDASDTFDWQFVRGFNHNTDYEYSLDSGNTWTTVIRKPIVVGKLAFDKGTVQVRVAASNVRNTPAGKPMLSDKAFTLTTVPAAPAWITVNNAINQFDWAFVDSFNELGLYEYSLDNGSSWIKATEKPQNIQDLDIPVGHLKVRVAEDDSLGHPTGLSSASEQSMTVTPVQPAQPVLDFANDSTNQINWLWVAGYNDPSFYEINLGNGWQDVTALPYLVGNVSLPANTISVRVKSNALDARPAGVPLVIRSAFTRSENQPKAPTSPIVDDAENTFAWTNVEGFTGSDSYEYSLDRGITFTPVTSNPQAIPDEVFSKGQVCVRVKAESDPLHDPGEALCSNKGYSVTPSMPPAPTSPVSHDGLDTFDWSFVSGFSEITDYEINALNTGWTVVTTKPYQLNDQAYAIDSIQVRVKRDPITGRPSGLELTNDVAFTVRPSTPSAPMGLVVNDADNTLDWTYFGEFTQPEQFEVTLDSGSTWTKVTAKPVVIGNVDKNIAEVQLRVRQNPTNGMPHGVATPTAQAFTKVFEIPAPTSPEIVNTFTGSNPVNTNGFQWAYLTANVEGQSVRFDQAEYYEFTNDKGLTWHPVVSKPQFIGPEAYDKANVGVRLKKNAKQGVSNSISDTLWATGASSRFTALKFVPMKTRSQVADFSYGGSWNTYSLNCIAEYDDKGQGEPTFWAERFSSEINTVFDKVAQVDDCGIAGWALPESSEVITLSQRDSATLPSNLRSYLVSNQTQNALADKNGVAITINKGQESLEQYYGKYAYPKWQLPSGAQLVIYIDASTTAIDTLLSAQGSIVKAAEAYLTTWLANNQKKAQSYATLETQAQAKAVELAAFTKPWLDELSAVTTKLTIYDFQVSVAQSRTDAESLEFITKVKAYKEKAAKLQQNSNGLNALVEGAKFAQKMAFIQKNSVMLTDATSAIGSASLASELHQASLDLYNAISVLESQYAQVTDFITQLNTATNGIGSEFDSLIALYQTLIKEMSTTATLHDLAQSKVLAKDGLKQAADNGFSVSQANAMVSNRFAKLDELGNYLPSDTTYQQGWRCVEDTKITGKRRVWALLKDGLPHGADDLAYDASATGYASILGSNELLASTNNNKLCGFSDWEVPHLAQLLSINTKAVEGSNSKMTLDTDVFPNYLGLKPKYDKSYFDDGTTFYYWSSAASGDQQYITSYDTKESSQTLAKARTDGSEDKVVLARLFREKSANYQYLNAQGTVVTNRQNAVCAQDTDSNLVWQLFSRGDSSRFKKYVDIAPLITAQNTKSICRKANWRYPTKAELYSLLPLNNEVFEFNEATGGSYGYYITSDPAPYGRFKGLNMTTMAETDVSTASYSSAYLYRLVAD